MDPDTELIAALRASGRRVTMPRLAVHRHLRAGARHVTAEQLHAELAEQIPSLSAATVYDTLDLLDGLARPAGRACRTPWPPTGWGSAPPARRAAARPSRGARRRAGAGGRPGAAWSRAARWRAARR